MPGCFGGRSGAVGRRFRPAATPNGDLYAGPGVKKAVTRWLASSGKPGITPPSRRSRPGA